MNCLLREAYIQDSMFSGSWNENIKTWVPNLYGNQWRIRNQSDRCYQGHGLDWKRSNTKGAKNTIANMILTLALHTCHEDGRVDRDQLVAAYLIRKRRLRKCASFMKLQALDCFHQDGLKDANKEFLVTQHAASPLLTWLWLEPGGAAGFHLMVSAARLRESIKKMRLRSFTLRKCF